MGIRKLSPEEVQAVNKRQFEFKREPVPAIQLTKAEPDKYLALFKTHNPGERMVTESEFLRWVEKVRATPITKRAAGAEAKNMSERKLGEGLFSDKIYDPSDKRVSKSIREFDENAKDVDLSAAARLLDNMAGRGEDATREPMYSPAPNFPTPGPSAADGRGADEYIRATPFSEVAAQYPVTRVGPNFLLAPVDPGIASPLNFSAPQPGPDPADGDEAVDFRSDSSPVFKTAHGVPKGLFSDIIKMEPGDGQYGQAPLAGGHDQPQPLSKRRRAE